MKTVIHVWTQKHTKYKETYPNSVGNYELDDLIRGSIGLFRYCRRNGYNLIVDFSLHPISSCLKENKHEFVEIINANSDNIIAVLDKDIDSFIKSSESDHVLIATSSNLDQFRIAAGPHLKQFIKKIFNFCQK